MAQHGTVYWTELMTHDADKACAFYQKTLGWQYHTMDGSHNNDGGANTDMTEHYSGPYHIAMLGENPVAGIYTMAGDHFRDVPDHWMPYMAVDNIDETVKTVAAEGGSVLREPFDIPNVGRIAILKDSNGAVLGLMTPLQQE